MSRALIVIVLVAACGNVQKAQPDAAVHPDAPNATLTVNVTGNGHITSTPAGIDCGTTCSGPFEEGTPITLSPASDSVGTFMGWGGACSGAGACEVVLTGNTTVSATFGCTGGMMMFDFTGAPQSWSPPCATTITVDVRGAGGGTSYFNSAIGTPTLGGRVQASLVVHPTDVVTIYVGGAGGNAAAGAPGLGGYNGGGDGAIFSGQWGGGGGGASDIRLNGAALTDRVIVAGGAGGDSCCGGSPFQGGIGGGLTGGDGQSCGNATEVTAKGGTQSAGGAGGLYPGYCQAAAGSSGVGGPACSGTMGTGGGGGGAGYFGGGGGSWNAGGGGSSYTVSTATNVMHTQGFQSGNGQVIITW